MKKRELEQLRSLKIESDKIAKKINKREENRHYKFYGDTTGDYSSGHKRIITIQGEADPEAEKYIAKMLRSKKIIDAKINVMEDWLSKVEPARTRNVLRLYYQEGKTQTAIGRELNLDRSVISRIISEAVEE